jgi:dTDP-4-amino-4,6-dideoxygalactose transaminase
MVPKPIVRFRDLSVRDSERVEILDAMDDLMRRGVFILGEDVEAFEAEFASRCGRLHGVGVANGTSALHLALRVLGVGPGMRS